MPRLRLPGLPHPDNWTAEDQAELREYLLCEAAETIDRDERVLLALRQLSDTIGNCDHAAQCDHQLALDWLRTRTENTIILRDWMIKLHEDVTRS